MGFIDRLKHSFNAFKDNDDLKFNDDYDFNVTSYSPNHNDRLFSQDKYIISALLNRIALDVASLTFKHVRLDEHDRYVETIKSGLNNVLTTEANIDQSARHFIQDVVLTLFEYGDMAIVPVETTENPNKIGSYDIKNVRVGRILEYHKTQVLLEVYNELTGNKEEITMAKRAVAIVENPLYLVMNQPNSTLKRLSRKLDIIDIIDEESVSKKLNMILQLPYTVRGEKRIAEADRRTKDLEKQMYTSKYGIGWVDATEKIVQLNRSLDNNLQTQVEFLTKTLYSQLGVSESVFNGVASEVEMLNYMNRTIEPVAAAIADAINRKFLTKTAKSQGQLVKYFIDPFKLVPIEKVANIGDALTRNEIMTSNEVRAILGMKPSTAPEADELRNKNLNKPENTDPYTEIPENTDPYTEIPDNQQEVAYE